MSGGQAQAFLEAARGDRYEALYVLCLMAGLRQGEALGWKWSDIDLDAGTLRVNRQLQRVRRDGEKTGKLVFSEPKNASRRTVGLPQRAMGALRSHRKRQLEEKRGPLYEDQGLVFATGPAVPSKLKTWNDLGPGTGEWEGALFLSSIGLGFLAVYLANHERWWTIIPSGAFLTLAVVAGLPTNLEGTAIAVVLFLGLALTFALLAVVPTEEDRRMRWPMIPAIALALIGTLVGIGSAGALSYVWPLALILTGLYLIVRTFGSGGRPRRHT